MEKTLNFSINELDESIDDNIIKNKVCKHSKLFEQLQALIVGGRQYDNIMDDEKDLVFYVHEHMDELDDESRELLDKNRYIIEMYDLCMISDIIGTVEDSRPLFGLFGLAAVNDIEGNHFNDEQLSYIKDVLGNIKDKSHKLYAFYETDPVAIRILAIIQPDINLNWVRTTHLTKMSNLFCNIHFNGDITLWDTSNVGHMANMFQNNRSFNQDLSGWQIKPDCDINGIFDGCPISNSHKPRCMQDGKIV